MKKSTERYAMALATLLVVSGALLATTAAKPPEPPPDASHSIGAILNVPPRVREILNQACNDCHSNHTRWPWYAKAGPISWVIAGDVEHGRRALNFSEWSRLKRASVIGSLMASCAAVESRQMPPAAYRLLHPEARLDDADASALCDWSNSQARAIHSSAPRIAATVRRRTIPPNTE